MEKIHKNMRFMLFIHLVPTFPPHDIIAEKGSINIKFGDCYLGDRDGLLLHDLVDGCAVAVHHLVKFIDAADALVCENQSSALQGHLPGDGVLHHRRSQTDSGTAPPSSVLTCIGECECGDRCESMSVCVCEYEELSQV